MALYRLAQAVLVLWFAYKFVVLIPQSHAYGVAGFVGAYVGGNLFDLRTWLLVIGLLLLRRRLLRTQLVTKEREKI